MNILQHMQYSVEIRFRVIELFLFDLNDLGQGSFDHPFSETVHSRKTSIFVARPFFGDCPFSETVNSRRPSIFGHRPFSKTIHIRRPSIFRDRSFSETVRFWTSSSLDHQRRDAVVYFQRSSTPCLFIHLYYIGYIGMTVYFSRLNQSKTD